MFRGSYDAKITEGRLKLPTDFEKLVNASDSKQFYVTSPDGKSAQIWPLEEWVKVETRLGEYSTMDDDVETYLNWTSSFGLQVEMDKQGRLSLPKALREEAKLEGEVKVRGKIAYMEVINLEMLKESLAARVVTAEVRAHVAGILKPRNAGGAP